MAKYQSKRVVVEAKQWFPPGHEKHDPSMLTTYAVGQTRKQGDLFLLERGGVPNEDRYAIYFPSGHVWVSPGDWIVTVPRTNIVDKHPCDPVTFEAKYEPFEPVLDPDIN
jgi:hypothetical protein